PIKKTQLSLETRRVHIPSYKTPNSEGDMPMTQLAWEAFKAQMDETPGSDYLFPTIKQNTRQPYITSLKKIWRSTLRRAGVEYFSLYELRRTLATRLSAGGVAGRVDTQMLRQGDRALLKL